MPTRESKTFQGNFLTETLRLYSTLLFFHSVFFQYYHAISSGQIFPRILLNTALHATDKI